MPAMADQALMAPFAVPASESEVALTAHANDTVKLLSTWCVKANTCCPGLSLSPWGVAGVRKGAGASLATGILESNWAAWKYHPEHFNI